MKQCKCGALVLSRIGQALTDRCSDCAARCATLERAVVEAAKRWFVEYVTAGAAERERDARTALSDAVAALLAEEGKA